MSEIDIDIDKLIKEAIENIEAQKRQRERPWTADIIKALWGQKSGLSMNQLASKLWAMRHAGRLPMPKEFTKTVQSTLNHHTSQSKVWDGKLENDLFYSPLGKGSGTWAAHQDRAIQSRGQSC